MFRYICSNCGSYFIIVDENEENFKIDEEVYCSYCYYGAIEKKEQEIALSEQIIASSEMVKKARKILKLSKEQKKQIKNRMFPAFGKIYPTGKFLYNSIKMRSGYEVAYAKWLDNQKIKWLYESKTFDLGICTYTPDFYLPEKEEYIEIKGRWFWKYTYKVELLKQLYSNVKIQILGKNDLQNIGILK